MAKVKPVRIEQEGMHTRGMKGKALRKVISRKLSEKEDSWNGGGISPNGTSQLEGVA